MVLLAAVVGLVDSVVFVDAVILVVEKWSEIPGCEDEFFPLSVVKCWMISTGFRVVRVSFPDSQKK